MKRVIKIFLSVIFMILGFYIALFMPYLIKPDFVKYISIAFIVCLIALINNFYINVEFNLKKLLMEFIFMPVIVLFVIFSFDRIGVDLYLPALIGFGLHLFSLLKMYIKKI